MKIMKVYVEVGLFSAKELLQNLLLRRNFSQQKIQPEWIAQD